MKMLPNCYVTEKNDGLPGASLDSLELMGDMNGFGGGDGYHDASGGHYSDARNCAEVDRDGTVPFLYMAI